MRPSSATRKAIAIRPDYVGAYNNLGQVFQDLGNLDEALASYHKAVAINPNFYEAERNLLFVILYVPGLSPDDIFAEHLRFSEKHTQDIAKPIEKLTNDPTPDRRLRIGYLSSDFRNHPVGANVLPLIASYDRANFEIFCYADISRPDAMTERFQSFVENWIPIDGKSDADVAGMIRADGIDILVSLAGHFDRNRPLICAHRAAPVQVSYHDGATSGLGEMDYWLTDGFLHPPDTKELFTEELQRLPVFYQYPPMEEAPPVGTLPTAKEGFVTFGSFNNPAKVNDEVIGLWAEVLKSVPGSRLLLKYKNWYAQESLQESLIKRFTTLGVGHDRVLFEASPDTLMGHLRRYEMIDIALDPFPFNGATTTFQALWMGVPVITLAGETFISRAAGSILHHVGLDDLTVDTPEAYVACARNLAGDIERLKKLRVELRGRVAASPLCDAPAYALCIEAAYLEMWRNWCSRHENTLMQRYRRCRVKSRRLLFKAGTVRVRLWQIPSVYGRRARPRRPIRRLRFGETAGPTDTRGFPHRPASSSSTVPRSTEPRSAPPWRRRCERWCWTPKSPSPGPPPGRRRHPGRRPGRWCRHG